MVRTLIIEDQNAERILQLLKAHEHWIEVIGVAKSKEEGKNMILQYTPELVFLDIELPNPNDGFDLLCELDEVFFYFIIFSGANKKDYPIQALRLASIDFLTKPISQGSLQFALERFNEFRSLPDYLTFCQKQVDLLKRNRELLAQKKWLLFITRGKGEIVSGKLPALSPKKLSFLSPLDEVIYVKSEGHYLHFYVNVPLMKLQRQVIRGKIANVEKAVDQYGFIRVHERYLVNRDYVELFIPNGIAPKIKGSGGVIKLENTLAINGQLGYEQLLPVARSERARITEILKEG